MHSDSAKGGTRSCDVRYIELGVSWLLRYKFELVGHSAEFGKRMGVHLLHRLAAVDLHRSFGDTQIAGDLFAEATTRDLNHDLNSMAPPLWFHFILSERNAGRGAR